MTTNNEQQRDAFNGWLYLGQKQYETDDLSEREKDIAILAFDAAIELDRKTTEKQLAAYRRLVNSLESRLTDLQAKHDELKKSTNPDLLASERAANAILTEELEADRKRRGEPVAWVTEDTTADLQMIDGRPRRMWWENKRGVGKPIYEAPQPAEPVKVRPETLSEHIARDIREGRFPDKSDRKMVPAEPVKVPSDVAHEIWAAAQTGPGEGIEDAAARIVAILTQYGQPAASEGTVKVPRNRQETQ